MKSGIQAVVLAPGLVTENIQLCSLCGAAMGKRQDPADQVN